MGKSVKMASSEGKLMKMHLLQPAAGRVIAYCTTTEVERFFAVIPADAHRDLLLFDAMYRYGLRRLEAAALRRDYLRDGRIWITRAKGGVSGEYPVHPVTRRLLWAYLNERGDDANPYLFVGRQSGVTHPLSPSMIYHLFRRYAEAAELPARHRHPHVLRHSMAVHVMNTGWDVADVQDWLGHRNIKSTMVYAAVTNKRRYANWERTKSSREIANNNWG
jgi:integrase/recombinase XerD